VLIFEFLYSGYNVVLSWDRRELVKLELPDFLTFTNQIETIIISLLLINLLARAFMLGPWAQITNDKTMITTAAFPAF
jgi:hypothetical protein